MADITKPNDVSTEQKILAAAAKVFTEKGFEGTRTRDIAEEAGINLALLNYYFRSKEKLFHQVMLAKIQEMFGTLLPILINETTTLEEKLNTAAEEYLNLLQANPNLPLFIISEIQKGNSGITSMLPVDEVLHNSATLRQISEQKPGINPMHFLVNFLGLIIFPFIARPLTERFGLMNPDEFYTFVEERRKLIPFWIKTLLEH